MKIMQLAFLAAGVIVFVIVIGSCMSVGNKVNHDQNTSNKVSQVINQVHVGMNESEVKAILGKPDDVTSTTDPYGTSDLYMYGTLSNQSFMLDFENNSLQSITQE